MGYISSINFKKSKDFQVFHNTDTRPSYAIDGKLEYNRNSDEARQEKQRIIDEAQEAYTKRTGQKRFQAKNYEWSAVCNIKDSTTMQDLEKLTEYFFKKYGWQCYQIAIHRDEGHFNEQGEKVINHHAHLEFVMLDKRGITSFKKGQFGVIKMREIQDEVAEILQMKRGQDKRLSGTKRIEPRQWAQIKEAEKKGKKELTQELRKETAQNADLQAELIATKKELESAKSDTLSPKAVKERIEQERKAWIAEQEHTAEDYKALRALKEEQHETIKSLELAIENLKYSLAREKQEREQEKNQLEAKLSDLSAKNQKNEDLLKENQKNDFRAISDPLNDNFQKLQKENEELQKENAILKSCFKAFSIFLKGERWQTPLKKVFSFIKNIDDHDKNLFNELSQDLKTYDQEQQAKKLEAFRKMQNKGLSR